jgi:hypothetical protein
MKRIRSLYRRARRSRPGLKADLGFAMITVIGYGVIIVLIASLVAAYVLNSIGSSRREQDYDAAVTAAQAGVAQVADMLESGTAPTALGSAGWTAVPGSTDANGNSCSAAGLTGPNLPATCPQYQFTTSYQNGDVTVYAEGRARKALGDSTEVDRAVKVTLTQANYTDYLYYSEVEASDPSDPLAYPQLPLLYPNGGPSDCGLRAWSTTSGGATRPASCQVPAWHTGDTTTGSVVHSNDLMTTTGSPTYNSQVTTEDPSCEATPTNTTPTCYTNAGGGTPNFEQGNPTYAAGQVVPNSSANAVDNLPATAAAQGLSECTYIGPTRIQYVGNKMEVWSPQTTYTPACGGGVTADILGEISGSLPLLGGVLNLTTSVLENLPLDQLTKLISTAAAAPTPISIPSVIYVENNPNNGTTAPAPTGIFCLLGKTLGMYGTLDPNPTTLLENPLEIGSNCGNGDLYVDGAFNGHSTVGADGTVTIMNNLYYSDAAGDSSPGSDHDGTNQLGLIANGPVEVWDPIQCTLALTTCLSLNPADSSGSYTDVVTGLLGLGSDIHIDAAIMSTEHYFGVSLPLLTPSVYLSVLDNAISGSIPTPKIDLYGSVYQYYRGTLGANVASANVSVNDLNVASAAINVGYYANYTYDQHLAVTPPPAFPTPATPSWVQGTFAEIPLSKLPSNI